jgi:hypothetical protein
MKIKTLILTMLCVPGIALAQTAPRAMQPRVLMGDSSHCKAVLLRDGHLIDEEVCTRVRNAEVAWDGHVAVISHSDEKASAEWERAHSLLRRLSVKHYDLYWDGKKVDLGKVDVYNLYEAIPWEGGVMIYGRTIPRRGFWGSWPFKGHFIEVRDIEPFCAIYFNPNTLKGEDLWLNGKAYLGFFVFPLPD